MAKLQKVERLRHELLSRGYSYAYVNRLVAELNDHHSSILESTPDEQLENPSNVFKRTEEQLGVHSALVDSFDHYPELKPWPQRHPLWMFVVLPGVALCLLTALTISSGEVIARGEWTESNSLNQFVLRNHWAATLLVFTLVASFFTWIAIKSRVPLYFLIAALSLIALNGTFVTDIGSCRQNESAISYSRFGFDFWRMVLPISICVFGVFIARKQQIPVVESFGAGNKMVGDPSSLIKTRMWISRFGPTTLLMTLVLIFFFFSATQTAKRVKRHSADKFVPGMLSETRRATDTVAMFKLDSVLADLNVNQEEKVAIRGAIKDWEQFKTTQSKLHLPNPPTMAEFNIFESQILRPELLKTQQFLFGRLTQAQRTRLEEIRYQYIENDIYFFPAIQSELNISSKQLKSIKDFLIERIRRDSPLYRANYYGDKTAPGKLIESRQLHDSCIANVLTPAQQQRLCQLRGNPVDLTVPKDLPSGQ